MRVQKLIALLILVIPGFLSMYGWKLMRDAFMAKFDPELGFQTLPFVSGLFLFIFGLVFVGGYIFYSDKKKRRVQPRFLDDLAEPEEKEQKRK